MNSSASIFNAVSSYLGQLVSISARALIVLCFAGFGLSGCNERPTDTELFHSARSGCNNGDEGYCYGLGVFYNNGIGVQADRTQAIIAFQKSCDDEFTNGCMALGQMWNEGVGENRPGAADAFLDACEMGEMNGCHGLAIMYANHRIGVLDADGDAANMLRYLNQACDGGFIDSCGALGQLYRDGLNVPPDYNLAAHYFDLACKQDSELGCRILEELTAAFYLGEEFEPQLPGLFDGACEVGSMNGCVYLGRLLWDGRAIEQDQSHALELFEDACREGAAIGCSTLARLYDEGIGVPANARRARRYRARACELDPENRC